MQGIQPSRLTDRELVRYAELMNNNGLPKEWADELIKRFDEKMFGPLETTPKPKRFDPFAFKK